MMKKDIRKEKSEVSFVARVLMAIDGVSSDLAIRIAESIGNANPNAVNHLNMRIHPFIKGIILEAVGYKKDGTPKKLYFKILEALE